MDEEYKPIITDEERATRRAQRAEARRKKQREKRRRLLRRLVPCGLLAVLCVGLVTVGAQLIEKPAPEMVKAERPFQVTSVASAPAPEPYARAVSGPDTIQFGEDFPSRCAVLVDLDTRTVLAEKNADTVISPASMTKVLTVLVAAEHITEAELDDTFTMTIDKGNFADQLAEFLYGGLLVAQNGQLMLDQGMIEDVYVCHDISPSIYRVE